MRMSEWLRAIGALIGNERAIANARRLLDQRRFEERLVVVLAGRVNEVAARAA